MFSTLVHKSNNPFTDDMNVNLGEYTVRSPLLLNQSYILCINCITIYVNVFIIYKNFVALLVVTTFVAECYNYIEKVVWQPSNSDLLKDI